MWIQCRQLRVIHYGIVIRIFLIQNRGRPNELYGELTFLRIRTVHCFLAYSNRKSRAVFRRLPCKSFESPAWRLKLRLAVQSSRAAATLSHLPGSLSLRSLATNAYHKPLRNAFALSVLQVPTLDMNFSQFDASFGVSQLLSQLTGSPDGIETLSAMSAKLRDNMPSASMLVAAGSTAAVGYALWEQIRFRMYRAGKQGSIAGECLCYLNMPYCVVCVASQVMHVHMGSSCAA